MKNILINKELAFTNVVVPTTFWQRARGLIGQKALNSDDAMWFDNCSSVHMFGMQFALDIVFLDNNNRVMKVVENLKPWQVAMAMGAKRVVELKSGICTQKGIVSGDQFSLISEATK
ncbi:hypothetical protein NBRC116583_00540 [Arenicella sp. 4NH20-0111]|uniref:DUF192 domain-containing protein n=1 Tax=Arenicella sp. 4NH20-0111 TaxID=3127648 RepID=UPI00310879D3